MRKKYKYSCRRPFLVLLLIALLGNVRSFGQVCLQNGSFETNNPNPIISNLLPPNCPPWMVASGQPNITPDGFNSSPMNPLGDGVRMSSDGGQTDGVFTNFRFINGVTYHICFEFMAYGLDPAGPPSPMAIQTDGIFNMMAVNGLIPTPPLPTPRAMPTFGLTQTIFNYDLNLATNPVVTAWQQVSLTFTPTATFDFLWIYPFKPTPNTPGSPSIHTYINNIRISEESHTMVNGIKTDNVTICEGDSVDIAINGAGSYSWTPSTGLNTSTGNYVTAKPTVTTTYTINKTSMLGCTVCDTTLTFTVNVKPKPTISTTTAVSVCKGRSVELTASASSGAIIEWFKCGSSAILQTGTSYSPPVLTGSTSFCVKSTLDGCVSDIKTIMVTVKACSPKDSAYCNEICLGTDSSWVVTNTLPASTWLSDPNFNTSSWNTPQVVKNKMVYNNTNGVKITINNPSTNTFGCFTQAEFDKIWEMQGAYPIWEASTGAGTIYTRKKVNIKEKIVSGKIFISHDDAYKLYINGSLASESTAWSVGAAEIDITAFLSTGDNLIAILVKDTGGCRWLKAKVCVRTVGCCVADDYNWTGGGSGALTTVYQTDSVGIGTNNPKAKLHVVGDVKINGTLATTGGYVPSDSRYKNQVTGLRGALSIIQSLNPVDYFYKTNDFPEMNFPKAKNYGFIAQDVEKILPEIVGKDNEGYYMLNYVELIPILTKALKEQQTQIDKLKSQIESLILLKKK